MGQLVTSEQPSLQEWESIVSAELLPVSLAITGSDRSEQPQLFFRFRRLATFRLAGLSVEGVTALPRTDLTERGYLKILFVTSGRSQIWRDGTTVSLEAGTWTLYDPIRSYRIDPIGLCDYVALALPVDAVPGIQVRAAEVARMAFPIEGNMLMALQAVTLCLDGQALITADEENATASAIATLLESGVRRFAGIATGISVTDREAFLLSQVEAEIQARAGDPDFTVESLIDTLQVSRRTLYNVFKQKGSTPYKAILGYRLDVSSRLLRDPAHRHRNVTDVALEVGFPDITHFARVFRRHFGITPSAYKKLLGDV